MAEVIRSTTTLEAKPSARPAKQPSALDYLSLPEELSVPSDDINDYSFLIHGEKKIGKTTLATVEGNVGLFTFDPLQKSQSILQVHVPEFTHLLRYLDLLETRVLAGTFPYVRVVLDGVDIMYRQCQKWAEKKLVVDHVSEEKWGRGWDLLKDTFMQTVSRFMALPGGCWFISHSEWRDVETRKGGPKVAKLVPLMKNGAEEILVGLVDVWAAYDYYGNERILIVRGDERTGAGHRVKGHFTTPDGRPVIEIPMGENEEEGWAYLHSAFRNEQGYATLKERDEATAIAAKGDETEEEIVIPEA